MAGIVTAAAAARLATLCWHTTGTARRHTASLEHRNPGTTCYAARRSGVGLTACHRPCCRCWKPGIPPSQPQACGWCRKGSRRTKKGHVPDRVTDTALMAEQLEHTTACILACLELCLRGWIWHKAAQFQSVPSLSSSGFRWTLICTCGLLLVPHKSGTQFVESLRSMLAETHCLGHKLS